MADEVTAPETPPETPLVKPPKIKADKKAKAKKVVAPVQRKSGKSVPKPSRAKLITTLSKLSSVHRMLIELDIDGIVNIPKNTIGQIAQACRVVRASMPLGGK